MGMVTLTTFITGNSFVWHKGNANELMTLTDSGNLGIGVNSSYS